MESQRASIGGTLQCSQSVAGAIDSTAELIGTIHPQSTLTAAIVAPFFVNLPPYTGEYELVPEVTDKIFDTKDTRMTDNIHMLAIPYHEVSNESGKTVIIGGISNGV